MMPAFKRIAPLLFAALCACTASFKPDTDKGPLRAKIVDTAMAQVGVPYKYAGANPQTGFDCSGLAAYSYAQAGVALPRSSVEQMGAGHEIPYRDAQPGDLLFYHFDSGGGSDGMHVVLFTGGTAGVHAPGRGRGVSLVNLGQPTWTSRYVTAVNVLAGVPVTAPPAAPATTPPIDPAPAEAPPPIVDAPADPAPADYGAKQNTAAPDDERWGASVLRP